MRILPRRTRLKKPIRLQKAVETPNVSRLSAPDNTANFTVTLDSPGSAELFNNTPGEDLDPVQFKLDWEAKLTLFKRSLLGTLSTHYAFTDAMDRVEEFLTESDSENGAIDPKASLRSEEMDEELVSLLEMRIIQIYTSAQYTAEDAKRLFEYTLTPEQAHKKPLGADYKMGEDNVTKWVRDLKEMQDRGRRERNASKGNDTPKLEPKSNVAVKRSRRKTEPTARQ